MDIATKLPIIWLIIILAAIFAEALSEGLVAIWFAPAALISLMCGFFDASPYGQMIAFVLSALFLICAAQIVRRAVYKKSRHNQTDTDIE